MHIDLAVVARSESELMRIVDAHEVIVERVCSGDAVGAGAAMAMHFDLSVASMSRVEQALHAADVPVAAYGSYAVMSASPRPKTSSKFDTPDAKARVARLIEQLRPVFAERLSVGAAVREQHGRGEAFAHGYPPDVIWPLSTAEVSQVVKVCNALRVPVIAFGAGTRSKVMSSALYGGICSSTCRA